MAPLKRNILIPIIFSLFLVLVVLYCIPLEVYAQAGAASSTEGLDGVASLGERLKITSYRLYLFSFLTVIGSFIAWFGGSLFDISLSLFTTDMVRLVNNLGFDVAIDEMWGIIRDIFNLLFIFGLIFAGFKIILGIDDAGSKRNIGTIILAALLINFSLYAAQVVVDFSNIAAHQIYGRITVDAAVERKTYLGIQVTPVSSAFMQFSNIKSLNDENQSQNLSRDLGLIEVNSLQGAIVLGLLFCIFYTILGFVFAACALLLFTRFFALIFLMIFSPVMFLGWVLPSMQEYSSKWKKYFLNQALVGPALIFMIYLSLRALQGIGNAAEGGIFSVAIYLLIVTAFLLASLKVATSLGAYGASMATNTGKKWGRGLAGYAGAAAGGATFGVAGRIGRATIGSSMQRYADSDAAKDAANSWWGRRKINVARRLGDASFDARNVGGMGNKLGLGGGIEGEKTRKERVTKEQKAYADSLGQVSDDDPRVAAAQLEADATDQAIKDKNKFIQQERKKLAGKKLDEKARQQIQAGIEAARAEKEELEETHTKQKEAVQNEKNRRQVGVRASIPADITAANKEINDLTKKIAETKASHQSAIGTNDEQRLTEELAEQKKALVSARVSLLHAQTKATVPEKLAIEIDTLKNELKSDLSKYHAESTEAEKAKRAQVIADKRKALKEKEKRADKLAGGFATNIEDFGIIKNFYIGSTKEINENSAEEIRKEYRKKSKTKE